jgi:hypothetical protein
VYTFIESTLEEAVEKFKDDTLVIFPPAHKSPAVVLTIFATFELLLPEELGLFTMVKVALSYPIMPDVADSKSKGNDWLKTTENERMKSMESERFIE